MLSIFKNVLMYLPNVKNISYKCRFSFNLKKNLNTNRFAHKR